MGLLTAMLLTATMVVLPTVAEALSIIPIRVENFRYVDGSGDSRTEVSVGTTLRWEWRSGGIPHSVTQGLTVSVPAGGARFDSGTHAEPFTFDWTFRSVGVFRYQCVLHPSMTGEVLVHPLSSS